MIVFKLYPTAALRAFASVPSPNFHFHGFRDSPLLICISFLIAFFLLPEFLKVKSSSSFLPLVKLPY
jgi:hypothetical protein